jgi:hypothetical protein
MVATKQQRDVSPIPPGRYWIEVLGDNRTDWFEWVRDMAGAVVVRVTEEDTNATPPVLFTIFEVPEGRAPFLNAAEFGFPNTAPPGVNSRQDVEQAPDEPLDWSERLQAAIEDMHPLGWVAVAVGAYVLLNGSGKGRR